MKIPFSKHLVKPAEKIRHSYRKGKARTLVTPLMNHDNSELRAIGNAISECLSNELSNEEHQVISRIEKRRATLLKSKQQISIIDYGAGSPNINRTTHEMKEGIPNKIMVSKMCQASKSRFWATLLFKLVRHLKPTSCLELGSCFGISAAYQGEALKLNNKGSLTTLEGSPEIAEIARDTVTSLNIQNVGVVVGPFHSTLSKVLQERASIDFLFNDGHHNRDAVLDYFSQSLPYLANPSIMVVDDISWSAGMREAWKEIETHEQVAASIDLRNIGIAILAKSSKTVNTFKIPL